MPAALRSHAAVAIGAANLATVDLGIDELETATEPRKGRHLLVWLRHDRTRALGDRARRNQRKGSARGALRDVRSSAQPLRWGRGASPAQPDRSAANVRVELCVSGGSSRRPLRSEPSRPRAPRAGRLPRPASRSTPSSRGCGRTPTRPDRSRRNRRMGGRVGTPGHAPEVNGCEPAWRLWTDRGGARRARGSTRRSTSCSTTSGRRRAD
jgi:hypothetical protein